MRRQSNFTTESIPQDIEDAIRSVHAFYRIGQKSLEQHPPGSVYGKMDAAAKALKINPEMLRKARVFADPKRGGYSEQELESLFKMMAKYRTPLGPSLIIKLITVADRQERAELQRVTLEKHWSCQELTTALKQRFGNRRKHAGRKPKIAGDAGAMRTNLLQLSTQWKRFADALGKPGQDEASAAVDGLQPGEARALAEANEKMTKLISKLTRKFPNTD